MDPKARKEFIESLVAASNFERHYTEANRRWMIGKTLAVVESRNTGDLVIKAKTTNVIQKAKPLVRKHRDFKTGLKLADRSLRATERTLTRRRVEILYGLIAHEPDLIDPAHEKQFLFIARRRYRTIERFQFFINPNGRGYLNYPKACPSNPDYRVNKSANDYWDPEDPADEYPLFMTLTQGAANAPKITNSINVIFTQKKGEPCNGNIFDCGTALSFIYMDSLLEAKAAEPLLKTLYARSPPGYLRIDVVHAGLHPSNLNDPDRNKYFLTDLTPNTLFTKEYIPEGDLQIGDHVYIQNHGIYRTLMPRLAWQGEHALLTDCGNRAIQDDNGYRFMGHGMPNGGQTGAIPRFYNNLLNDLNTQIWRCFRVGALFLAYKKSGDTLFPGKVSKETQTGVPDLQGQVRTVDFYFFNLDFSYVNRSGKAPKSSSFAKIREHGFVIWHIPASNEFGIHEKKSIAKARADGIAMKQNGVRFRRSRPSVTPAELFEPFDWIIRFPDNNSPDDVDTRDFFIFKKKGSAMEPQQLEMNELYREPLGKFYDEAAAGAFVTRPKLDVSSSYTTFLTSSGAL